MKYAISIAAGKKIAVNSSYQRVDTVPCSEAIVDRLPRVAIVSRAKYTDRATQRIAASENVTDRVDGKGQKRSIRDSSVELGPTISVISRTECTAAKSCGEDVSAVMRKLLLALNQTLKPTACFA